MNRDDITRMALEAGFTGTTDHPVLIHFAALVAAAERDACIALCEEHWRNGGNAMECADTIRERLKK